MTLEPARERRRRGGLLVLLALGVLALAWILLPLGELLRPQVLAERTAALRGHPLAPLLVLGGFVIAGALMLPITPMVIVAISAFPPLVGFCYALLGTTMLALASFAVGRWAGRGRLDRLSGTRVHQVSQRLADAGVLAITLVRMVPIAHFTVVSLTAGASHIRWRDFVLGTIIGMIPGVGTIALLFDRAAAVARDPGAPQIFALVLVCLGIVAVLVAARLWLRRR